MNLENMTKEEAKNAMKTVQEQVAILQKKFPELVETKKSARIIKVGQKGGFYLKDPSFKAFSEKKQKVYTAGINMDLGVAKALFLNEELLGQVQEFLAQLDGGDDNTPTEGENTAVA